jgi:hypothetical protein
MGNSSAVNTQAYWIPHHIRVCPLFASTIVLDLKRNRYFGIGKGETRALSAVALNWSEVQGATNDLEPMTLETAAPIAEALVDAGLLSREAPTSVSISTGSIDLTSTLTSVGHELTRETSMQLTHIVSFLRALAWAGRGLRTRTLYSLACEVGEWKGGNVKFDEERAIELVSLFRRLRPHTFAARERCLFHALTLVKFLSYYEVFPAWVIGVRAKPWGAHSWVQQGTLLLDANPEHVCEYAPILTV